MDERLQQVILDELTETLYSYMSEYELPSEDAFSRISAEWLGYDAENEDSFIDGAGDFGIDFWYGTDSGFDIFQVKSHELQAGKIDQSQFDSRGVRDLERAKNFLIGGKNTAVQNRGLSAFRDEWQRVIDNKVAFSQAMNDSTTSGPSLSVTLNLIVLGEGLSRQAMQEFDILTQTLAEPVFVQDVSIQFFATLYTISGLMERRALERYSQRREKFELDLTPVESGVINDNNSAVFYCKAIDLVKAYTIHGYGLFETNVRAYLRKSEINKKIRDTVRRRHDRHNFHLFNNGITIACDGYALPKEQRKAFRLYNPQIVNGLQTIVALHSAYDELKANEEDRQDFEECCYVLVRALTMGKHLDVNTIALTTNTQNAMEPRNLRSNQTEQLYFVRSLADLGWFYETKDGAWEAFKDNHRKWRPNLGKRPSDFREGKGRERRINNVKLAQAWLAFVGFSNEAANERKELFSKSDYYDFVFRSRPLYHGAEYNFSFAQASSAAQKHIPSVHLPLLAFLIHEFVTQQLPTARAIRDLRDEAKKRLESDDDEYQKKQEQQDYVKWQALRSMRLVFVEIVGYILFRALHEQIYDYEKVILNNGSFRDMVATYDVSGVVDRVKNRNFDDFDLLPRLWLDFEDIVGDLVYRSWGTDFVEALVKSRFTFSTRSRRQIVQAVNDHDEYLRLRGGRRPWHGAIPEGMGLYDFVGYVLSNS